MPGRLTARVSGSTSTGGFPTELPTGLPTGLPTVSGTVKERSLVRHEEIVRLHLKPTLGNVKLPKLNALGVLLTADLFD